MHGLRPQSTHFDLIDSHVFSIRVAGPLLILLPLAYLWLPPRPKALQLRAFRSVDGAIRGLGKSRRYSHNSVGVANSSSKHLEVEKHSRIKDCSVAFSRRTSSASRDIQTSLAQTVGAWESLFLARQASNGGREEYWWRAGARIGKPPIRAPSRRIFYFGFDMPESWAKEFASWSKQVSIQRDMEEISLRLVVDHLNQTSWNAQLERPASRLVATTAGQSVLGYLIIPAAARLGD